MSILHDYSWKFRVIQALLGHSSIEKRPPRKTKHRRNTIPAENLHLLRDLGLTDHVAAHSVDGRR